jgi:predicted ABC-class ATPase
MLSTVDPHRRLSAAARHHLKRSMTRKIGSGSGSGSNTSKNTFPPYMFERTDVCCEEDDTLCVSLRIITETEHKENAGDDVDMDDATSSSSSVDTFKKDFLTEVLGQVTDHATNGVLCHVATAVFQERLRGQLSTALEAVAFVADGSILPRRSGASSMPMASPPALPFKAPESRMRKQVAVDMGKLCEYLRLDKTVSSVDGTTVTLTGLVIPHGVTLIVGGGYHGKSTLLRCIASGVYDKIPGDGREFSVTVRDAVTVRAEDGRYVNNCNVSAFISNLPTPPGVDKTNDTSKFCTREASGSTSQASNVSEAIEMGASAMLVDEDVR